MVGAPVDNTGCTSGDVGCGPGVRTVWNGPPTGCGYDPGVGVN